MGTYKSTPSTDFGKAMETKRENIAEAQKRKNDNIQIAGLQRDATLLTVAEVNSLVILDKGEHTREMIEDGMEKMWQKWHEFLQGKLDNQILGF